MDWLSGMLLDRSDSVPVPVPAQSSLPVPVTVPVPDDHYRSQCIRAVAVNKCQQQRRSKSLLMDSSSSSSSSGGMMMLRSERNYSNHKNREEVQRKSKKNCFTRKMSRAEDEGDIVSSSISSFAIVEMLARADFNEIQRGGVGGGNCLGCERLSQDGNPFCPKCHVTLVYTKEYDDLFGCSFCTCQSQRSSAASLGRISTGNPNANSKKCSCGCHDGSGLPGSGYQSESGRAGGIPSGSVSNWASPKLLLEKTKSSCACPSPISSSLIHQQGAEMARNLNLAQLNFPPEILCMIFEKLDEVSLLRASKVNSKWDEIISEHYAEEFWEDLLFERFPIFQLHPKYQDHQNQNGKIPSSGFETRFWKNVYMQMLDSLSCTSCFLSATSTNVPVPNFNENPGESRSSRLDKELLAILLFKMDGIDVVPLDEAKYNWLARVQGPHSTPYEGGIFYINLKFPTNYPFQGCQGRFLTKIFHPNVNLHGDIHMEEFEPRFSSPADTIRSILMSIQNLLKKPNPRPRPRSEPNPNPNPNPNPDPDPDRIVTLDLDEEEEIDFPQSSPPHNITFLKNLNRDRLHTTLSQILNRCHFSSFGVPSPRTGTGTVTGTGTGTETSPGPPHPCSSSTMKSANEDSPSKSSFRKIQEIQNQIISLYIHDRQKFNQIARKWTRKFGILHFENH